MISVAIPATRKPRPQETAAAPAPAVRRRLLRSSSLFHVARQILAAEGDHERAAVLLKLSDGLLLDKHGELLAACGAAGFSIGADYLTLRLAALHATRDRFGCLSAATLEQLETWRRAFVAIANGSPT
jgi:hypothetical protein